jgi:hypothetical protein
MMAQSPAVRSPILFVVFNRPDTVRRVFEAIRTAAPSRLYVAADGPRPDRPDDRSRCAEVRRIVTAVDWPCELRTLFRDANVGCKLGPSDAITWFFEHEEEGIILEDDILPTPSFFRFCDELLDRYRDVPSIGHITGFCANVPPSDPRFDLTFSKHGEIWGWATWRRVWLLYDRDLTQWQQSRNHGRWQQYDDREPGSRKYWTDLLDRCCDPDIDVWDAQYLYCLWSHGLLSIMPRHNLVENIGFGDDATHTTRLRWSRSRVTGRELSFPLTLPGSLERDVGRDRKFSAVVFGLSRMGRLRAWASSAVRTTVAILKRTGAAFGVIPSRAGR